MADLVVVVPLYKTDVDAPVIVMQAAEASLAGPCGRIDLLSGSDDSGPDTVRKLIADVAAVGAARVAAELATRARNRESVRISSQDAAELRGIRKPCAHCLLS